MDRVVGCDATLFLYLVNDDDVHYRRRYIQTIVVSRERSQRGRHVLEKRQHQHRYSRFLSVACSARPLRTQLLFWDVVAILVGLCPIRTQSPFGVPLPAPNPPSMSSRTHAKDSGPLRFIHLCSAHHMETQLPCPPGRARPPSSNARPPPASLIIIIVISIVVQPPFPPFDYCSLPHGRRRSAGLSSDVLRLPADLSPLPDTLSLCLPRVRLVRRCAIREGAMSCMRWSPDTWMHSVPPTD